MDDAGRAEALAPVSPGELLKEEFLDPMGISQCRLAKEIGVPAQRIGQIVLGRRSVTADTDLRLCRFFGLSDGYFPTVIGCAHRRPTIRMSPVPASPRSSRRSGRGRVLPPCRTLCRAAASRVGCTDPVPDPPGRPAPSGIPCSCGINLLDTTKRAAIRQGFDNEKYLDPQSAHIKERIAQFGGKPCLEFGGELFDDCHASRVLPGFEHWLVSAVLP